MKFKIIDNQKVIKDFSNSFVSALGEFVKKQKELVNNSMTNAQIDTIITKTFYLLGRNHKRWQKISGIK